MASEASGGDEEAAQERAAFLRGISRLGVTDAAGELAARLVERGAVPRKAAEDALHIAIAAVHGVDYSRSISEVLIALNGTRYRMQCHA